MRRCLSLLYFCLLAVVHALSSSGSRLLVVLEDAAQKLDYSMFWADLEARGYILSFESPKNEKLSLFRHGERVYDHLLLLPPKSKGYGPALNPKNILNFMNEDGNVILALSGKSATSSAITSLLLELDIHLPADRSSFITDHFNYDTLSAPDNHDILLIQPPKPLRPDTKNFFGGKNVLAIPRPVQQILGARSALLAPILSAPATAYSYNPKEDFLSPEDIEATGSQLSIISTMQARNSARFTVLGSVESLEDKWFTATVKGPSDKTEAETGNREFAKQLTAWTFKETGVLKVKRVYHHISKHDETAQAELSPTIYRVMNETTFHIELSEYSYDRFIPFEIPSGDAIQLEFTMLSPFYRLTLSPSRRTNDSTVYSASFTIPDQHGIFSFRVTYDRPFLTNIEEKYEVTVRHLAHDEYPRSWQISGGWVWIAGLWSVIGGFFAFVVIWLYLEPATAVLVSKKAQ